MRGSFVGVGLLGALALGWWLGVDQALLRVLLNQLALTVLAVGVAIVVLGGLAEARGAVAVGVLVAVVGGVLGVGTRVRLAAWAGVFDRQLGTGAEAPDTLFLPRRVLPLSVADAFARRALTDSRFVLGSLEPTMTAGGRLVWQAPLTPNSIGAYFTHGIATVIEVDADTTKPDVRQVSLRLPVGGEGNFANFGRLIARTVAPLCEPQEPVYDTHARAALVPLLRWVWGVPSYVGVARFDSVGTVTLLTPAEAATQHPHLRLVPETLVRWQAQTWGEYRQGFFGFLSKTGLYRVAELGANPAPTLLDNAERGAWVVPMEPHGASFGLTGLLFVDARTGATRWWNTAAQSLPSPSQVLRVAVDDPRISILKNAQAAEPKLGILSGRVHYLVPIVPASGSQVQKLVVVDAGSSRVLVGDTFDQVWGAAREEASSTATAAAAPAATRPAVAAALEAMAQTIQRLQAQLDSLRAATRP